MIEIHRASDADVMAIRHVAEASWRMIYGGAYPAGYVERFLTRTYAEDKLKRTIANAGTTFLVAKEQTELHGFCYFGRPVLDDCQDRYEIYQLYVHPQWWRQGIGRALLTHTETLIRQHEGITAYFCYIPINNTLAQTFFGAMGLFHDATRDKGEMFWNKSL